MRIVLGGMMLAAGVALISIPASTASPMRGEARAVTGAGIEQVQYGRGRYCERLRRACEYKEERGEQGMGNCARYRRECA